MKQRLAVAFTGPSNSGKTTVIEKIARQLVPHQKIAIVKNDPKDKAIFDVEGKDSWKFFQTGADVAVVSPTRTTLFSHQPRDIDELVAMFGAFDLLMVEGLKWLPLPRIAIFRGKIDLDYFNYCEAIAIDDSINPGDYTIPDSIDILDLNAEHAIIEWINQHAKEI